MKLIKQLLLLIVGAFTILSCSQQKARRPISQSSGTFMKESAERNKKLIATEEAKIDSIIKWIILRLQKDIGTIMKVKTNWTLCDLKKEMLPILIMKSKI